MELSSQGSGADSASLSAELSRDSRIVRELQSRHSSLVSSKSSIIRQLREVNAQLANFVGKITEHKAARDRETVAVRELKVKRQKANEHVKVLSPEMKKALDAKEAAVSSLSKVRGGQAKRKSASQLYSEMEALEMRIITEAMPFSKENELMEIVHEKRKQLEAVRAFSEAMKSHRELFSRFSELRRQSYSFHADLQKHAASSQKFHEEMIAAVGKVRELRQKKNLLLGQLGKAKAEYGSAATELQQRLHGISEARKQLDSINLAKKKEAEERRKAVIEQKETQLTEKLRSGKKLTARDLIALQGKESFTATFI